MSNAEKIRHCRIVLSKLNDLLVRCVAVVVEITLLFLSIKLYPVVESGNFIGFNFSDKHMFKSAQ